MNKILTKALEELRAEKPRIDYVIGMLETLLEMQVTPQTAQSDRIPYVKHVGDTGQKDEATILDGKARAAIEVVRALSEESTME